MAVIHQEITEALDFIGIDNKNIFIQA